MALTGIILQALAGAIYGISYLVGNERMDKWRESTKTWLANARNRIIISYFMTFLTPLALAIYMSAIQENNIEWYNLIPGVIIFWGFISLIWTSFLLSLTKSKKLANIFNHPRINQMMRNSNIVLIFVGIILVILGGIAIDRQTGLVIGTDIVSNIVPIILLAIAMTAFFIGFVLVFMPVIFYLFILFVNCVGMLLRPGKAVWILALTLFLAGSVFLIINETVQG